MYRFDKPTRQVGWVANMNGPPRCARCRRVMYGSDPADPRRLPSGQGRGCGGWQRGPRAVITWSLLGARGARGARRSRTHARAALSCASNTKPVVRIASHGTTSPLAPRSSARAPSPCPSGTHPSRPSTRSSGEALVTSCDKFRVTSASTGGNAPPRRSRVARGPQGALVDGQGNRPWHTHESGKRAEDPKEGHGIRRDRQSSAGIVPSALRPCPSEPRSSRAVSCLKIRGAVSQRGGRALPPIVRNRDGAVLDDGAPPPPSQPLPHDEIRVEGEADHNHTPRARQGPRGAPRGVPPSLHPPAHLDRALRLHGRLAPRRLRAPHGAMAPPPSGREP